MVWLLCDDYILRCYIGLREARLYPIGVSMHSLRYRGRRALIEAWTQEDVQAKANEILELWERADLNEAQERLQEAI